MVSILLSTFNGEKYLSQQIDSILNQTFKNWTLYIRDDGSSDSTINIIKSYENRFLNIHFLEDSIVQRGAKESFFWLLNKIDSNYYMFCDQDDFWFDNKVSVSFEALLNLEDKNYHIPSLVFTDLSVVDQNLNLISSSMWDFAGFNPFNNIQLIEIFPLITGCTMIFNKAVKNCTKYFSRAPMHDSLIGLSVYHNNGRILCLNQPTLYYRQHDNNTLGIKKRVSRMEKFFKLKVTVENNLKYLYFVNAVTKRPIYKLFYLKIKFFFCRSI